MSLEQTSNLPPARPARNVWLAALVRPSVAAYAALGQQPSASAWRAYVWVFVGALLSGAITLLAPAARQSVQAGYVDAFLPASLALSAIIAVCYLAAFAWCAQQLARLLKGSGSYGQLIFVCAAFSAPLLSAASILDLIPPARVLLVALYVYWLALYVVAVRAVHGISRLRAIVVVLAALVLLGAAWLGVAFMVGYWGLLLP
jgi:hypothetical protein